MRGVQGAALRRQRSRLDAQRRGTSGSLAEAGEVRRATERLTAPGSILFGITLFHIGLVFLFIGFLMVITAMIPGYIESDKARDVVGTGSFFVCFGGALTLLNRILSKREEDSLSEYVSTRLARSKSGGRLVRDAESGLTPEIPRRAGRAAASRKTSLAAPLVASRRSSQLTPTHSSHSSHSPLATPNDVHVLLPEGEKTKNASKNGKDAAAKMEKNNSTVSTVSASQV